MAQFIEMKLGKGTVLVEVAEKDDAVYRSDEDEKVLKKLDQVLDNVIQQQIVEHCKILVGAFGQLKDQSMTPKKAHAEFGLQFNAEGNVYVAKIGAESSFKVAFEWEF